MSPITILQFLIGKPTVDNWYDRLTRNPHRDNLLKCLLSDMPLVDKSIVLDRYLAANTLQWLESKLTTPKNANLAQLIRCALFFTQPQTTMENDTKWSTLMIRADIKARSIVQREVYVHEEICALRKAQSLHSLLIPRPQFHLPPFTAEEKARLSAYEEELQCLDTQYTEHKRYMWFLEGGMPLSALGWAFETCQKDPNWYLSKWLRRDCAGRGGCCGRSSQCCERPRETMRWGWNWGHCTSACGCCLRTRDHGKEGKVKLDGDLKMPATIPDDFRAMYNVRMHFAYIWGFDLLDDISRFSCVGER